LVSCIVVPSREELPLWQTAQQQVRQAAQDVPELESPPVVGSGRSSEDGLANAEGLMISNFPQSAWNEPPRVSWRPFRLDGRGPHLSRQVQIPSGVVRRRCATEPVWSLLARVLSLGKMQKDTPKQGYQSKGQASEEQLCTKLSPGRKREGTSSFHLLSLEKYEPLAMTKSLGRADHRQSANPRNEETFGFLVPLFFPTETSRPAHCLAFDFCHFLHLELIFCRHRPWRQAMGHAQGQRADHRRRRRSPGPIACACHPPLYQ